MRRKSRSSSNPRSARALASVVAAGLTCAAWVGPARAQSPTRPSAPVALAEQYAERAFEAYEHHDFARAIQLYQQALDAAPSADILYNIARVYDLGLLDRRRATDYYERYVADPGAVTARIEVARSRLEELRATAPASGERAGAATNVQLADIARDFPLDPLDTLEPPRPRKPVEPQDGGLRPLETAAVTLGSMGLVGIGVGIGFGIAASARSDDWQHDCDGNACRSPESVEAAESARRSATVATVGFAAGGGLLALGAALWLIDSGNESTDRQSALQLAPFVHGAGGGTLLSGRF
jgi:hypothetical protein